MLMIDNDFLKFYLPNVMVKDYNVIIDIIIDK